MSQPQEAAPDRFCPKCGGALERRVLKETEPARNTCSSCGFVLYANPKVAACTICLVDGGIVLLRRAIEPELGKWVFPGGFVDRGEPLTEAAIRETAEEVKLKVSLLGILDAYTFPPHEIVVVVYAADVVNGTPQAADEASEVKVFPPEEIPWDELAFPSTRAALRDYIRRYFPRVRVPR
jgi:ADP-ribose pyrophosphatase YjhB (NUDIX family)